MLIGELAEKSGFSRHTLRYYEKQGLLPGNAYSRRSNNYRDYPRSALARLNQIRQFKQLGYTLSEMLAVFSAPEYSEQPCRPLPTQLDAKIEAIDKQIAQLQQLRRRMAQVKSACTGDCAPNHGVPECLSPQCC